MHKEKKPFAFEECYQVLQALPKFKYLMILGTGPMNEEGYDSNPVTPTGSFQHFETPGEFCPNAQTDTNSSENQISKPLQRPLGQKATKRAKRLGASSSSSSLESIIDETSNKITNIFRENQEKRQHQRDSQNERLDMAMQLKREELAMKRREEEDRIMSINTQNMPPDLRFYWQQRQQEIISRRGIPPGNRF
ncbi:hypothetical protein BVC80_1405g12 [Macleaya cordata]|uniref:No apical meristem-associated C-terminal domain-containing protein n=1 Tax=Macleaya cordata TaxID=56857 RepID=A0A200QEG7_MACCD|nr:hypothetical protein BVC80_1405g12 [Macleaya cordata]